MPTLMEYTSNAITEKDAYKVAEAIYEKRDEDPTFGYYLLEKKPETPCPLAEDLYNDAKKHGEHKMYTITSVTEGLLGYILLKDYHETVIDDPLSQKEKSTSKVFCPTLEVSYRSLIPGVCARALHDIIDIFRGENGKGHHIGALLGHHATGNIASGMVFKNNGFAGIRYHNDYVTLPNFPSLDQRSDTIMWLLQQARYSYKKYEEKKNESLITDSHSSTRNIQSRYNTILIQKEMGQLPIFPNKIGR